MFCEISLESSASTLSLAQWYEACEDDRIAGQRKFLREILSLGYFCLFNDFRFISGFEFCEENGAQLVERIRLYRLHGNIPKKSSS
jgi:hypothetical protein